ncbi:MAG: cell envelope integrity protein TolA [Gammaproteobacteria bacterium]|jgi:colicin import membrane protein
MKPLAPDYKRALYCALSLHILIVLMMLFEIDFPWENEKPAISYALENAEIIQAHTVSQQALDAQEKRKLEKQRAIEAARQAEIEKQKRAEAARLAEIEKQKQLELAKKEAAAKKAQEVKQAELAKQEAAKAEAAKAEAAKQAELAQAEAAKQQQLAAEQAALDAQRQAQIQQANASEIARYSAMVKQKVMQNWLLQRGFEGLSTELHVRVAPSGNVLDVQITKRSGNDAFDRSAVAAVHRSSPLPVPTDPTLFESFREIRLILRPEDVLG